ncbi:MAG: glucose dehydrogenase [Blastopirellula sp.]|nr:MAG: glucose dehydrogenase [Blastopirellula sp.]
MFQSFVVIPAFVLSITQLNAADVPKPEEPQIAPVSNEGESAIAGFDVPEGLEMELWAAEPLLANPVVFCFDPSGRIYVAETFRQGKGVEDNRKHNYWLTDDLAAQTVEDRRAYILKHHPEAAEEYTKHDDRIRLIEDTDGDGKADKATVFSEHYNDIVEGTGAGVLYHKGDVFYTNIPNLWRLRDNDGDGKAEVRKSLHNGYGVRFAFRGHDMHGLIMGPDGKIYYSIGDRGYNIKTQGKHLKDPGSGAVFRCNPDGSELEVFYTGLRNPQELAFDDFGNLFTGDNNSDSGDLARWVYLIEGGHSGWNMAYQYLGDRGPWNREKLWHPFHEGQASYINPPIENISDGPSGLAHYPGTGLGEKYRNTFFLCDFRGGPANSGVRTFKMKTQGANFELVDSDKFVWKTLVTDVDFGPDGGVYVSDWVDGWNGLNKGRIYRIYDPVESKSKIVAEVKRLLNGGFAAMSDNELAKLLSHLDRRIRQAAQFELVDREAVESLEQVAATSKNQLGRLHAIWGIGQLARVKPNYEERAKAASLLTKTLIKDEDPEVRAQAAKVLGDLKLTIGLVDLLDDPNARVKYFAMLGFGKTGPQGDTNQLIARVVENLAANADADPVLRHGGMMALAGTKNIKGLADLADHPSVAVRKAAIVALRRLGSPSIVRYLKDSDEQVILEAARAIHDLPIEPAMPQLAKLINQGYSDDALLRRILNANFRIGDQESANNLAQFAGRTDMPTAIRLEALAMLQTWDKPGELDRVLNFYRPLVARDKQVAKKALTHSLSSILASSGKVHSEGARVAAELGMKEVIPALKKIVLDQQQPEQTRADALRAVVSLEKDSKPLVLQGLQSDVPRIRAVARDLLASIAPEEALVALTEGINSETTIERQAALASLASTKIKGGASLIVSSLRKLIDGKLPADTHLDALEAAQAFKGNKKIIALLSDYQSSLNSEDPLAKYRTALSGGDAELGKKIFFEKTEVSCVRCHRAQGTGGRVGPELDAIGKEKLRDYLLEAIVLPNAKIAKGFESILVLTEDGKTFSGVLKEETDDAINIVDAKGNLITIPQDEVEATRSAKSPMPEDIFKHLSQRELRDLVEFLSGLKADKKDAAHEE